jgi:hypothetical protein
MIKAFRLPNRLEPSSGVLATSTNVSLNSPSASVIVAGLLDLVIGDDYEIFAIR